MVGQAHRRQRCGMLASGQALQTCPSIDHCCITTLYTKYVLAAFLIFVMMVFPVAMRAPVGGVPIHHARLSHHDLRFCHNDGGALHDHRLRDYYRRRLHNHRAGNNRDRQTHPNGDLNPACLRWERQSEADHPDQRHHPQRAYKGAYT